MVGKCVFCEIIDKNVPARIIAETESMLCILDSNPVARGHCLIIPKKHFIDIFESDDVSLNEVMGFVKQISSKLKFKLGAKGVNVLHASGKEAQQSVFHFHMHIIPRYEKDGLDMWPKNKYKRESLEDIKTSLLL
ncbi:MAG: HIT family protein [Candidatus Nanoarchaeia archaeon]